MNDPRSLNFYATSPLVGSGLPLWLPDGAVLRAELEKLVAEEARRGGCLPVYTPVLAKRELFERSGHWAKFADDMFPPMDVGGEQFVLRPANCPHHALVYASAQRSYRELPLRYAELGAMFRSELSGVLSGLSRVRQINLDDCHVFCAPEQVEDEVVRALEAVQRCYALLGVEVASYRLSLRGEGEGYLGDDARWAKAEQALRAALARLDLPYVEAAGEAAFYGPKIDVQVDFGGREESLSTVQLDFSQPERFDLGYIGPDGARHRPVMVHRGVLSSMERMVAYLVERYAHPAGHAVALPAWLSPVQVAILPVSAGHESACRQLYERMLEAGLRCEVHGADATLGARIRAARERQVPYVAVVGDREVAEHTVSVRLRDGKQLADVAAEEFLGRVVERVSARSPVL